MRCSELASLSRWLLPAAFPPAMQVPPSTPRSLSLGSLGATTKQNSNSTIMKQSSILIPVLLMAALNWKAITNHSAADGLSSSSSILGVTAITSLIGLGLSAFLLWAVYRALRVWLDGGVLACSRLSAWLIPHPQLYFILAAFVFGFHHSYSGVDSEGSYSREIYVGSACGTAPLWLAALSITLWNVLCVLGRSYPDETAVPAESSPAHT